MGTQGHFYGLASRVLRKARTGLFYVIVFHVVRVFCDALIPNFHAGNRVRGFLFRPFFKRCGKRFAIASGCTINGAWNLSVGDDVYIAHRCWINATGGLVLEDGVIISPNVVIATTSHAREGNKVSLRKSNLSPIRIGAGSWIASNSVVTKGSIIAEGVIVSAGSVVSCNLERNALYSGNPLVLKRRL